MSRPLICSVLASLLLCCSVAAQDLEQRQEAVREFQRFFRTYREVEQRVEAVHTLEGMECVAAVEALLPILRDKEERVAASAYRVLATYAEPKSFAQLVADVAEERNAEKRARWIRVLGASRVAAAVPVLVEIVTETKRLDDAVRYEIARALGLIGDPAASEALGVLLTDEEAPVRLAACDAITAMRLVEHSDAVIARLQDDEWTVRSAATRSLGVLRPQAAIDPLIELMRDGGRLREDAAEALFAITTYDFGVDPDEWARQMKRLASIGWKVPSDAEVAKAAAARQRSEEYYGKSTEASFGGIQTSSTRILFVIDVSGSMEGPVVEKERFTSGYDDFKKLTIVKTELIRTIEGLGPDTMFNIVSFATDLKSWKRYLVQANVVNRSSATTWVKRLEAIGGQQAMSAGSLVAGGGDGKTNTYKALLYPFGIDPEKSGKSRSKGDSRVGGLDTVFFLSDGRPSTGIEVDTQRILEHVLEINERHQIVFHTIAIGDFQSDFLRSLARGTGGVFVDLGR